MSSLDIQDDDRFQINKRLTTEYVDDELVVFDLDHDTYFSFNEVAGLIWKGLTRDDTFADLVDTVVEAYDIERDRARADTTEFLEDALARDLIERHDREGAEP